MVSNNYISDFSNNIIYSSSGVRLSPQTVELHAARVTNLRISSITDIVMACAFIIGLGFVIYFIIVTLHAN
jgi:hypothetical protein